jgi:predicted nucleotidyltransferase
MSGTNWRNFVDSIREAGTYRNRIKSLDSDMADYLDTGPQKKGGYQNKRAKFKGKKFNDVSAPPGAAGGLEEEVEPESFDVHSGLEPTIWKNDELSPKIRSHLLKIAQDFIDGLPVEVDVEDITLTGSIANYTWSNYSDIDLHIIVDFLGMDANRALIKSFFDNARMRWNDTHNIRIRGYDVEIYVEDSREIHKSSGIYSVLNDEWVKKPKKYQSGIDFGSARRKADDLEFQTNIVSNLVTAGRYKKALKNIERLKQKIRNMRRAGLESRRQEFSVENIAFKILRRNGILDLLSDLKTQTYDSMMNIDAESHRGTK